MAPSLAAIAESIQRQPATRWFWHSNHLAARLGITFRKARRAEVYWAEGRDEEEDKCERRGVVKHNNRKSTCAMGSFQLYEFLLTYSESALAQRISDDVQKEYSIRDVNSSGLLKSDKEYTRKRMDFLAEKQKKNLSNERRTNMTLEEHRQQAKSWQTRHDAAWNTREQVEKLVRISKLLTKGAWSRIPAAMLEDEVRDVLPAFWRTYKKTTKRFTKSHLVRAAKEGDTWKDHLGTFLQLVVNISDGKSKTIISTKRRAKELKRAKATKCNLLLEFVLADQSQWLAALVKGEEEKREKMRAIILSSGDQICNQKQWQGKTIDAAEVKIDFQLTFVVDPDLTHPDNM